MRTWERDTSVTSNHVWKRECNGVIRARAEHGEDISAF